MKAQLKFLNGEREGVTYTLREGRTVVGRQVGDITLADKEVSSIHAIVSYEREAWYIMDLGSTNGVWVNEQLQPEARLQDGTEVRIGQSRLLFCLEEDAGAETEPTLGTTPDGAGPEPVVGLEPGFPGATDQTMELSGVPEEVAAAMAAEGADFASGPQEGAAEQRGLSPFEIVLEVIEGADWGLVYRFNSETILLGRLNTDLVVRDSDVSRRHAIIEVFEDELVYIRDLGSTNGTYVNGQRVSTVKLSPSDQLKLGRCTLSYDYRIL
jgi:pSer/pThr/pTyr-binding forkhead associated (FHA) protein